MSLTISKYEIFKTIVELGSLSKTAEKLNLTQSGVSYAISSLESELGFPLFRRERSGMSLTPNGARILTHVQNILEHEELLRQEATSIKGLDTGTVRIGHAVERLYAMATGNTGQIPSGISQYRG